MAEFTSPQAENDATELAEVWDRAHQEKYQAVGGCAYQPSCVESGYHPNPFREAIARRFLTVEEPDDCSCQQYGYHQRATRHPASECRVTSTEETKE